MKITLNETEERISRHIGKQRYEECRRLNAKATVYGNRNKLKAEVDSYGAELAFCKLVNVCPSLTTIPVKDSYDCLMPNGIRVDVKQTELVKGRLLVKSTKNNGYCDVFVLMIGELPDYTFAGWIYADKTMKAEYLKNLGYGNGSECYAIEQNQLEKDLTILSDRVKQ